jgi:hypothetical protein
VLPEGSGISVCNSRNPDGPAWIYTRDEIAAFILAARDGDFDDLTRYPMTMSVFVGPRAVNLFAPKRVAVKRRKGFS